MKLWQLVTIENLAVAGAYFAISWIILSGLVRTGQLTSNKLGFATGLIFFTCGVHHGAHSIHMLLPSLGLDEKHGLLMRQAWDWHVGLWDFVTAAVGIYYLSLRGSYASVLRGAQMFEDMKVRQRQAMEINDNIVQGLTVAKYQLDRGKDEDSREAIEQTLRKARELITDLLGERGTEMELGPGDLRRSVAATVQGEQPPEA
jgi:signal transduction histidine kinase